MSGAEYQHRSTPFRARSTSLSVVAAAIAIGAGTAAAVWPPAAALIVLTAAAVIVLVLLDEIADMFLGALGILLVGYAFFSRGFAHVGAASVYVGEIGLVLGLVALVVALPRLRLSPIHALLVAFMAFGLVRTIPFLHAYGSSALRDATLWGYAFFALAVSASVRIEHIEKLLRTYRRLIPWFLVWAPVGLMAAHFYGAKFPHAPGSDLSLLSLKGGDMGVHLAGIAAFLLLGLDHGRDAIRRNAMWAAWFVGAGVVASANRGGFLALSVSVAGALLVRGAAPRRVSFLSVGAFVLAVVVIVNPTISLGGGRSASLTQLSVNALSIASDNHDAHLQGTKSFRLAWWHKIEHYTLHGPYFWGGKGFGVNLADDDGFQPTANHSLRAPHNTHMTILARMGVPGLGLWTLLQGSFALALATAAQRARRRGQHFWARLDAWLLLYWLAMIVNTSFDPYLEGPQGSIWFWSLFGFGLAALRLQQLRPTLAGETAT